jgi:uncharacterized membrane protein
MSSFNQVPLSLWFVALLDLVVLVFAIYRAPVKVVARVRGIQHLFLGSVVALIFLWRLRAGLSSGLEIHFLGMTTLTLVLGWDLAVCAGVLICLGTTAMFQPHWHLLPLDVLGKVIVPVLVTSGILTVVKQKLPKNFFVYFFICAFLAGGLGAAATILTRGGYLGLAGVYPWTTVVDEYFLYLPLIFFPEAFLNGTLMTAMLVYLPDWVRTFDSKHYINGK